MGRKKKIKCKSCSKPLFYLPSNYDMGVPIECIECADGKKPKKNIRTASSMFARTRKGKREDLGDDVFRSATEANFARVLTKLGIKYKFEQRTFFFHDYKNKPHQYTPDFEIPKGTKGFKPGWYEIKGWFRKEDRNKRRRFKKNYPDEAAKFTVVVYRSSEKKNIEFCKQQGFNVMFYDKLTKEHAATIPTWEG
jgi:hypothetical protein